MTNDYAALVAMLDQAAADLQAEIDAAIDRHGLLVRTANQLRAEADGPSVAAEPVAILSVHERCTQEQRDALKHGRWTIQLDGRAQTIDGPPPAPRLHSDVPRALMTFTEPPDWHQHAACAGTDPDLFFPGRGQPITDARRVCATCPVKAECLDYAITNGETIGVWGGTSDMAAHRRRTGGAA